VGSKIGWVLALVLILVVACILYFVVLNPWPSLPRYSNAEGFLDLQVPTVPISEILGYEPSEPGNAADDYEKAVRACTLNWTTIEASGDAKIQDSAANAADLWSDPAMKACKEIAEHVAAGARKKSMQYSFLYTPKQLKVRYHLRHAEQLYKVSVAVHLLYQIRLARKEYPEADKLLKDLFALGNHMLTEHALAQVEVEGAYLLTVVMERFQQLYGQWDEAHKLLLPRIKEYQVSLGKVSENFRRKRQMLWDDIPGTDPDTHQPTLLAGDVFNEAENDQDRAWRVQAILALGPLKFRASSWADRKKTRELLDRFLMSKDEVICAAAKAADELTREQFRGLATATDEETE